MQVGLIQNLINVDLKEVDLSLEKQKECIFNFLTLSVILENLDFDIGGKPNDVATKLIVKSYGITKDYFDSIFLKGYNNNWMKEHRMEDAAIARIIKICNSENRLPIVEEIKDIENIIIDHPHDLPLQTRRETFWVYAVAHLALKVSKNVDKEENKYYPSKLVLVEYGVDTNQLEEILNEGNANGWMELLPKIQVTFLIMKCDNEKRLPTITEIKKVLTF